MPQYTTEDYAAAKARLERLTDQMASYSGNNPNKHRADVAAARATLHQIETDLKARGVLPRTSDEERDALLDSAFPNAQSKEVVEWQGRRYVRRFSPVSKSLSGKTVNEWHKFWEEVAE